MSEAFAYAGPEATLHDRLLAPIRFHPLADIFPLIEGAPYRELLEDIRANGVLEPIVMHDRMILDGRNRYLAAREAGVPWPTVEFTGSDPVAYVISLNLRRRHMSESQRAMVAAKLAKMPAHRPAGDNPANLRTSEVSQMLGVSPRSIETARFVEREGSPALVAAVEADEVAVSAAAEVARLEPEAQAAVVEAGAVREVARELRSGAEPSGLGASIMERLKAGHAPTQEAVRDAIKQVSASPARPRQAKPTDYVDDPAFRALSAVVGAANSITAKLNEHGADFIVRGFLDDGMRQRNVTDIAAARDALTQILEACRAE